MTTIRDLLDSSNPWDDHIDVLIDTNPLLVGELLLETVQLLKAVS